MSGNLISRALVSVSDKSKLDVIIDFLSKHDVEILTTGGTYKYIKKINSKVKLTQISDLTGCDEILDGRVKTLHPKNTRWNSCR